MWAKMGIYVTINFAWLNNAKNQFKHPLEVELHNFKILLNKEIFICQPVHRK